MIDRAENAMVPYSKVFVYSRSITMFYVMIDLHDYWIDMT